MSAQSATAHTRRAHGRLSVKPPAVPTSASRARDWHSEGGGRWHTTTTPVHVNSRPFTRTAGHQGLTAALEHFSVYTVLTPVLQIKSFYEKFIIHTQNIYLSMY